MPSFQPGNYNLLDRSNGQNTAFSTSPPLHSLSPEPLKLVGEGLLQRGALDPAGQATFTYYKNFVDSSSFPDEDVDEYREYDDGYTDCIATGSAGSQFLDQPGSVPCNLTARLANRSNGAPLATIIEQCSRSTLNSRVSLLSVGRVASLQSSKHVSPSRGSQKKLNSADDTELSHAQEDVPPVQDTCSITGTTIANEGGSILPTINNTSQMQLGDKSPANFTEYQLGDAKRTTGGQKLSAFFRDVLHTVQTTSRARPWSSPLIQTAAVKVKDRRSAPTQDSPRSHERKSDIAQTICDRLSASGSSNGPTPDPTLTPVEDPQTRSRQTSSSADSAFSARADPPLLAVLSHESEFTADTSSVPRLLPPSVATRSRERSASVHYVQPKPRDRAHNGGTAEAPSLPGERRSDTPVHYTFESVSVYHGNAALLAQCDRAIETSRNASFCSTMSTSYSGTVLGVDLDLGSELVGVQNLRRSRSPTPVAPPVWFTPQMAELERQASVSESPEQTLHNRPNTTSHSMRSFALTSLLPIAAASGVVTPNYNTPKISFYSPSGNLIQPESSSSPGTGSSEFSGSPTGTLSYYHNIRSSPLRKASPAATCLPPVRPALVPMTTPPIFSAPLPAHLRHHYNYRHPEKSQIEPTESFILPTPAVRGCGGFVKSPSFTPRSGIRHQHKKSKAGAYDKHRRSIKSMTHDLRFEANFYKAGLITKASTSCGPSRKRKVLRKRHVVNKSTEQGTCSYKKKNRSAARKPSTSLEHDHRTLGPFAGHALRICFCQPYDGAGRSTHALAADASCIRRSKSAPISVHPAKRSQERVEDVDGELPNARVVGTNTGPTERARMEAAGARAGIRARLRSDGVGVGLRVAAVGA